MVGIILAAGDGIRLKKGTGEDICKPLKKINDIHLIEYSLDNLIKLDVEQVIIVIGKQGDLIKNAIGYKYKCLTVSYVCQAQQKGLINAFIQALDITENDKDVILQLADEIFINFKAKNVKSLIDKNDYDFYCGITYENDPEKIKNNFSIDIDKNLIIKNCTEKPTIVTNNLKGTGFCIFKQNVLQILKNIYDENANTPNNLCDYINYLIKENKKGLVFCLAEKEFNINTYSDLEEVKSFFDQIHK